MRRFVVASSLAWLAPDAWACATPSSEHALEASLDRVEQAFADLDDAGIDAALVEAGAHLGCLDQVVAPELAGRFHRAQGLAAWKIDDQKQIWALAGAKAAAPDATFPFAVVPEGEALHGDLADAQPGASERVDPAAGQLHFDGRPATERPTQRATIFQEADPSGAVVQSHYLWPGDALPAYARPEAVPLPVASPSPTEGDPAASAATSGRLLKLTGAGLGVIAGGLYGAALWSESTFHNDDTLALDDLTGLQSRTNSLSVAAGGVAAVAAVTGGVGFVIAR